MNDRPILETEHLTKRFGGLPALLDLSIKAIKAQITSIIGPNGAGKTTLFNLLTGFLRPDEGDYYLMGKKITGLAPYRITRQGMARSPRRPGNGDRPGCSGGWSPRPGGEGWGFLFDHSLALFLGIYIDLAIHFPNKAAACLAK